MEISYNDGTKWRVTKSEYRIGIIPETAESEADHGADRSSKITKSCDVDVLKTEKSSRDSRPQVLS